jgi:hypothetical protein
VLQNADIFTRYEHRPRFGPGSIGTGSILAATASPEPWGKSEAKDAFRDLRQIGRRGDAGAAGRVITVPAGNEGAHMWWCDKSMSRT